MFLNIIFYIKNENYEKVKTCEIIDYHIILIFIFINGEVSKWIKSTF